MTRREALGLFGAPLLAARRDLLLGFNPTQEIFSAWGYTKKIYTILGGPPVLFLHELPGLVPEAFDLARRLNKAGMSVYLPLFFGKAGQNSDARVLLEVPCWGSEFDCRSRHSMGQIVNWVVEYGLHLATRYPRGLAVIGNCLTGAMPLALLADGRLRRHIKCVVLSQPAVPFGLTGMPRNPDVRRSLGLTDTQMKKAAQSNVPVLALRFTDDPYVPEDRMFALRDLFNGHDFEYYPVPPDHKCPGHEGLTPKHHHAVLTLGYCEDPKSSGNKAYRKVEHFLRKNLGLGVQQ